VSKRKKKKIENTPELDSSGS